MKEPNIPVAKEGIPFIMFSAFLTLILAILGNVIASYVLLGVTAFILYFFRDPERISCEDEDALLSPADGKVILIEKVFDERYVNEIRSLDVRLILSMHWRRPAESLRRAPVDLLWLPTFDSPMTPIPISSLFKGVEAALPLINEGQRVLVHCQAGIHRSVAMACCVLIGTGYSAKDAMKLVKEQRDIADPYIWYIKSRIKKFELDWNRRY